jgi:hypothetical protein
MATIQLFCRSTAAHAGLEHNEAYLEGFGLEQFPGMPEPPFDRKKDVIVVAGELADSDFRSGESRQRLVDSVLNQLLL